MDVVANTGNYILWSDCTNNVHTASARMHVDLKVMLQEFRMRRGAGLKIPSHAYFIEDKAADHRNWDRIFLAAILVKNDILLLVALLWLMTGHSHGCVDQLMGGMCSDITALPYGLVNEKILEKIFKNLKHEVVNARLNFVEELDDIADVSGFLDKVYVGNCTWCILASEQKR